jgi:hypothetical protein
MDWYRPYSQIRNDMTCKHLMGVVYKLLDQVRAAMWLRTFQSWSYEMASDYIPPYKSDGSPKKLPSKPDSTPWVLPTVPCESCGHFFGYNSTRCPKCSFLRKASRHRWKSEAITDKADVTPTVQTNRSDNIQHGHLRQSYSTGAESDPFSILKGAMVFLGGVVILLAIFCPPVGIPAISLFALGKLISSFGKD